MCSPNIAATQISGFHVLPSGSKCFGQLPGHQFPGSGRRTAMCVLSKLPVNAPLTHNRWMIPADTQKPAETALQQINEKKYDAELTAAGVKTIYKYGVAFSGKKVEVAVG